MNNTIPAPVPEQGRKAPALAVEPLLLPAPQAAAACGMSLATWHRRNAAGLVPAPLRIGGCVRWRLAELQAWCAAGCPERSTWQAISSQNGNGRNRL